MNETKIKGIDVSRYQGTVDFEKVKADGVKFAMLKISQGSRLSDPKSEPFTDVMFYENSDGFVKSGIYIGGYHYLTSTTPDGVKKECEYLVKVLESYKNKIVYPVACDIEDGRYKVLPKELNSVLYNTFYEEVKKAGYSPILYTNTSFLKSYYDKSSLCDTDIWFAKYRNVPSYEPKPDIKNMTIYQWNSKGVVSGIDGNVDMNVSYVDYAEKAIKVGRKVKIKDGASRYWNGGPLIPNFVKERLMEVVRTSANGKDVVRGDGKCYLLSSINTWVSVDNLELIV